MKQLFILRGLPGSSKSSLASLLNKALEGSLILSADDLRMVDGNYQFNLEWEPDVWERFEQLFYEALDDGIDNIIIDNTNLMRIHYEHFKEAGIQRGYQVHEIIVGDFDIENSYKRCIHAVPKDKIEKMKQVFEFPR